MEDEGMAYADYDFYQNQYKGSVVPSSEFEELSERATEYVDSQILVNISDIYTDYPSVIPTELKKCVCRLCEIAYLEMNNPKVASESVGSYSRSFENNGTSQSYESRLNFAMRVFLGKTGLLYKGIH
jgi:hypothetical protein